MNFAELSREILPSRYSHELTIVFRKFGWWERGADQHKKFNQTTYLSSYFVFIEIIFRKHFNLVIIFPLPSPILQINVFFVSWVYINPNS